MRKAILAASISVLAVALPMCAAGFQGQTKKRTFSNEDVLSYKNTNAASKETTTEISIISERGDQAGQGKTYFYKKIDGLFSCKAQDRSGDGAVDTIRAEFEGKGDRISLEFSTRAPEENLRVGTYATAQAGGNAAMSISVNGQTCNSAFGKFSITEMQLDRSQKPPKVISFAVSFEQICARGGKGPGLTGSFYFNSAPPEYAK